MKTLIIATNRARFPYGVAPIGAAAIVSALRLDGWQADLLDLGTARNPENALRAVLRSARPDIIGLSVRNLDNCSYHRPQTYFPETRQIVDLVRRDSQAEVIVGGSAMSVGKDELLAYLGVRYGIVGEGEVSLPRFLRERAKGPGAAVAIPGLLRVENGQTNFTPPDFGADPDQLPLNQPLNIDYRRYCRGGSFISIQTRRGCPFKCVYCEYPLLEGCGFRLRSPARCVDDMARAAAETGRRNFFFVDSAFNLPVQHARGICEELIRRNLKIRWTAYCNPLGLDRDLARLFKLSGCIGVELGLDAAVDKMLANLGKCFTQRDIRDACAALAAEQLPFAHHLLFGGPGETWQDIEETRQFLDQTPPANAVFASLGLRIYRDTPLYAQLLKEGFLTADTNLLEPRYYVSPHLGADAATRLDAFACTRPTWLTPADWDSRLIGFIQGLSGRLGLIPSWKDVESYGKRLRPHFKRFREAKHT